MASSFPRDPGTAFVDLQYTSYESGTYLNANGQASPAGCTFEKQETSLYGEVGLTKRDTLTGSLPYDWISCGGQSARGFTDLEVGLNHNLHRGASTTFGVRADVIVPTGYPITTDLRLGYGRLGTEESVLYGGSIGRMGFYDTQTGVRVYSGYPAPAFHALDTLGAHVGKSLIYGQLDYYTNVGPGTTIVGIGQNPTIEPAYTALQGTVAATLQLHPGGSLFVGTTSLIYGRNTGQGHSLSVGYWATF